MLYKTTLKLLLINTTTRTLLVPLVSNSYRKTLWLLKHREVDAKVVGIIEGQYEDLGKLNVGEVDATKVHAFIIKTPNITYTSVGKQPETPDTFEVDLSLDTKSFIIKYAKLFTPDEMMVVLGTRHVDIFKVIGNLIKNNEYTYTPESGPGKWTFYDYFWLHERYRHRVLLDIRNIINRPTSQIKFRAYAIGLVRKRTKRIVSSIQLDMQKPQDTLSTCICGANICTQNQCINCHNVTLSSVDRDYMISQVSDLVTNILNK